MRKMRFVVFTAFLLLVCIGMIPKSTQAAGGASPIENLEGQRIMTWWPVGGTPPEFWISTDEYAYVHHGYNSEEQYDSKHWSEFSGMEKAEFITTSTYELSIDDNPIKLNRAQWYNREADIANVIYYIQFKPGDLAPGDYQFTGTWYSEVGGEPLVGPRGECPISLTVTVHVY